MRVPAVIGALRARDLMRTRVVRVSPTMSVRRLAQVLAARGISGAPVVDRAGRVVGVVSASDLVRLAAQAGEIPVGLAGWEVEEEPGAGYGDDGPRAEMDWAARQPAGVPEPSTASERAFDDLTVADVMTPAVFSLPPEATLDELVQMLVRGHIHRVLVMEGQALVGVVTAGDVLEAIYRG